MSHADVAKLLARTSVRKASPPPAELPARKGRGRGRSLPQAMTLAEAAAIAGSLGHPSKMPGYSYGLDAWQCRRGSVMVHVPGSVCAGCYARSDFYRTKREALIARERRHAGLTHPRWADAMVRMISHYCQPGDWRGVDLGKLHHIDLDDDEIEIRGVPFFRWHDSGDLVDAAHLARIVEVCERTPLVWHWLPSREFETIAEYVEGGGTFPPNLTVRLSALMIDSEPPRPIPGQATPPGTIVIPDSIAHLPTSTVHTPGAPLPVEGKGSIACRAVELRENKCGSCRACWRREVRNVSYPQH